MGAHGPPHGVPWAPIDDGEVDDDDADDDNDDDDDEEHDCNDDNDDDADDDRATKIKVSLRVNALANDVKHKTCCKLIEKQCSNYEPERKPTDQQTTKAESTNRETPKN